MIPNLSDYTLSNAKLQVAILNIYAGFTCQAGAYQDRGN